MYHNHKLAYLEFITDSKKRRTFRLYFGGQNLPWLNFTKKAIKKERELHGILEKLEKKGVNLAEDGLGDFLEDWKQVTLKLIQKTFLQSKKIKELENKLAKKAEKVKKLSDK